MDAASARIAANDLDGAVKILQQADALKGPLTPEIEENLQLWQAVKGLVDTGRYTEAQQALQNFLASSSAGAHRTDAQQYLDKAIPQLQAQKYLAQGDFQSARRAADALKQKGGNPAELVAKIDQAERDELGKLKNQFDQLKQHSDSQAIQQLKALQPKFQALAGDGGPQSREAQGYADNIPGAIADVQARAGKKIGGKNSTGSQCDVLNERLQLGEALSEEERAFLKANCH